MYISGKTYTMFGQDSGPQTLGIVPCAIAWLFKLINEQKDHTGARFSVRVSAVEVSGKQETLKDLLAEVAQGRCYIHVPHGFCCKHRCTYKLFIGRKTVQSNRGLVKEECLKKRKLP